MLKRINQLIRDIERDPFSGIGKPEPLRGNLSGMWSRRIDQANRLIYEVSGDALMLHSAKDHYEWAVPVLKQAPIDTAPPAQ